MKRAHVMVLALFALSSGSVAQTTVTSPAQIPDTTSLRATSSASQAEPTSAAQRKIASAKLQTQKHPERLQNYNDLAIAYVGRARETSDPAYYQNAEQAMQTALKLAPDDFRLLKTQIVILLGRHEYAEARENAQVLNRRTPDDVAVYGYLAASNRELGNYDEAENAAQWMLNLLPNNIPGLLAAAELRNVYGDPEGALELLSQAYTETSPDETEELAWIANRVACVQIGSGKIDAAERALERAQQLVADYPYSLENLARVRMSQNRFGEAVELLRLRNRQSANARISYKLAGALEKAGRLDEAKIAYANFERDAQAQTNAVDNANLQLILYYADSTRNAAEALNIARRETGLRKDVFTLDAYAWALYVNGQYAEGRKEIQKAIAVGVRDSQIFFHAGAIAAKVGDSEAAAHYFEESLATDSHSEYSSRARTALKAVSADAVPDQKLSAEKNTREDIAKASGLAPFAPTPKNMADPPSTVEHSEFSNRVGAESQAFQPIPAMLLVPRPTETDRAIKNTQGKVARNPNQPGAYAQLGAAFFQKARETGDVSNFELAEQALSKSLELASDDLSAAGPTLTMAEVCMGEHRFADALTYAQKASSFGSGDLSPFAVEGDAYTDTGEYEKAAVAYSKLQEAGALTKLNSTSYAAASRLSYLKFLSGDTQSSIHLMQDAVAAAVAAELPSENLAWLYFELGEHYFQAGNAPAADKSYFTALEIHPGDYRAVAGLGRVRANEGKYAEAIELYRRAIAVVPMPSFIAELGDVYLKTGQTAEATKQFQLIEYIGLLGNINKVLHNRDLAIFYADHDMNLVQSLELARKELEVRHDIYTWDALGWALYKNGKFQEAAEAMTKSLRLNTKDAILLFHAGMIYQALGQNSQAREYLSQALAINPKFHVIYSGMARQQLAKLTNESPEAANGKASNAP